MPTIRLRQRLQQWATYDCFPEFSAQVRCWLYNPLGILVVAMFISLLCGVLLHPHGFTLGAAILLVLAFGVSWPWLTMRGVTAQVQFDRPRIAEGERVGVRIVVRHRWPWPLIGLALHGGFGLAETKPLVAIARVPRRCSVSCRWDFHATQRGVYPTEVPSLGSAFPFGLWENRCRVSVPQPLLVWPRMLPVGPVPPVSGARQVEGNVARNKVGTSGDVMGVRPYRRGDSPRRIHWGQSARHDRLIVCELQTNSRPVIQIVLDVDASVHVGSGSDHSLEWAIRIAASMANGWLEHGASVGLAWGKRNIPPASGATQRTAILDALATVQAESDCRLENVLACPVCHGFRDGLQVIITTDGHAPHGCRTCAEEEQRWVVLERQAFAPMVPPTPSHQHAWLTICTIAEIPAQLRSGWAEARHGS